MRNRGICPLFGTTTLLVMGPPKAGDPPREHIPDLPRGLIMAAAAEHPIMPNIVRRRAGANRTTGLLDTEVFEALTDSRTPVERASHT